MSDKSGNAQRSRDEQGLRELESDVEFRDGITAFNPDESDAGDSVEVDMSSVAEDFFQMSLDNVCVAGFDGFFKRLNPSWERTLGWTTDELLSRPLIEFVHPDDREKTLAGRGRLKAAQELGLLRNRYICKDGTYRWLDWRCGVHLQRGLVYAVARDVTEEELAKQQLQESQRTQEEMRQQLIFADRMASVGTLAAGVAHEINNPLAYTSTNIALLIEELVGLEGEDGDATQKWSRSMRELAAEALAGAERIRDIVRGLKTFSRADVEQRSVIDLQPLVELSVKMTSNEIRHRARLVEDYGDIPHVEADEARLGQVFVNLLINAAHALPEEGGAQHEIHVRTMTDGAGRAVVEVRDTGVGIPAAIVDRVFDPFFTTKQVGVGTGLGLSICHNIVTSIGGEISVESIEGEGATFRVVLPAASHVVAAAEPVAAAIAHGTTRARVLVLDDEPSIGRVVSRILGAHDVTVTTSAQEALVLLSAGEQFDVVFSDLMMPEMSGMEFYAELTERFPDVAHRVIFISGGAFTPGATGFLERVPNRCIDKPFSAAQLREVVQRHAVGNLAG